MTTYLVQTGYGVQEVEGADYSINENGMLTILSRGGRAATFAPGKWEFISIKREEAQ